MAGETADTKQNRSKLVQCEKNPKIQNKGISWLSTTEDEARRKTVHFGSRQRGAQRLS